MMTILATIGVSAIVAFNGVSEGLTENWDYYAATCYAPDAFVTTNIKNYKNYTDGILGVEGVEDFDSSIFMPCSTYIEERQETKSTQIFSFSKSDKYKPSILSEIDYIPGYANVYVDANFAKKNDIVTGQKLKMGYFDVKIEVNVCGILRYPDSIKYGASNALAAENTNFGRIYIEKQQLYNMIDALIVRLEEARDSGKIGGLTITPFILDALETLLPILKEYAMYANTAETTGNRLMVYFDKGADRVETLARLENYLLSESFDVNESYLFENSLSAKTIRTNADSLKSAGFALSLFMFGTMILIISLFLNQIIKGMMKDIGVMSAIGFRKEQIMVLLAVFTFLVSIIGSALGVGFGHLIELGLDIAVEKVYSLDVIAVSFKFIPSLLSTIMVVLASQVATFISAFNILKINPVDALNMQSTKKKVSDKLDRRLKNATPNMKLAINSIATKPKRFIISFVSIFASALIIFNAAAAYTSYNTALDQTFRNCLNYEAQVIFSKEYSDFESKLQSIGASDYEMCKYATAPLTFNGQKETITIEGLNLDTKKISIPKKIYDSNPIPSDGITINKTIAKHMKIKEGDTVLIGENEVKVAYISNFALFNVCICSIDKIAEYTDFQVESYLIGSVDKEKLIDLVSNHYFDAAVSFTKDQRSFFEANFKSIQLACIVFLIFSICLGALIVSLMMQISLTEQKRDLCIMRSIGFSMNQISFLWSIQIIAQYILAGIFAVPLGFLSIKAMLAMTITKSNCVSSAASIVHVLITAALVALFLIVSHLLCMRSVKKWNIAENTKNRE